MAQMVKIKYVGNADHRNTASEIALKGRPPIPIGGVGSVTKDELENLRGAGLIVEVVTSETDLDEPLPHVHDDGVSHAHALNFDDMSGATIDAIFDDHSVEAKGTGAQGKVLNSDLAKALKSVH